MNNMLNELADSSYKLKVVSKNVANRSNNEWKKEKLECISDWAGNFSASMDALSDLMDIKKIINEFKTIVGNNFEKDLENIAAIAKMLIDFTDKYRINTLIVKADLIGLFEKFIEYSDSIADFRQIKDYSKDSIFPIIISSIKKSHHFKETLSPKK